MNASVLKRTLAIAAAVAVPWAGWSVWSARREAAAKEALAAEIRAEMEARKRLPQVEEDGLADHTEAYRAALQGLDNPPVPQAVHDALFRAERWNMVPIEVASFLGEWGPALDAFEAAVGGLPPGRVVLTEQEWLRLGSVSNLLLARGRVRATTGDLAGLFDTVGRLRRISEVVKRSEAADHPAWSGPLTIRMEGAAFGLLALLVLDPALTEKEAAEALAIAGGPWAVAEARTHAGAWVLEQCDRFCLDLLADDALEKMKRWNMVDDPSVERRVENLLRGRSRKERTGPRGPPGAEVMRRMRQVCERQKAAFERRDAEGIRLGGPLDLEAHEDLGGGWVASWVSPYCRMGRSQWVWEARLAVLRAAFAIRLHEIRTGGSPASLEELVPGVLDSVPKDPWSGQPVKFTPRPNGWTLEAGHPDATFRHPGGWAESQSPYRLVK